MQIRYKSKRKDEFIGYLEHSYIVYGFTFSYSEYGDVELDGQVHVLLKDLYNQGCFKPSFKVNFYDVLKGLSMTEEQLVRLIDE